MTKNQINSNQIRQGSISAEHLQEDVSIGDPIVLNDSVTSESTTEAATARAVKEAYDKGSEALVVASLPVTKESVGLSSVDDVKQMPISGGTLEDYREKLVALSNGVINLSLGNVFTHTLSGNITYSITGATSGVAHSFTLFVMQGATARVLTFPSSVKWEVVPILSVANKTHILSFMSINGGLTWHGVYGGAF